MKRQGESLIDRHVYADGDAASNLLERRWFAAFKAASGARTECESLLELMARAEAAWSLARVRLYELESLRDALEEELETLDGRAAPHECDAVTSDGDCSAEMSAA
jgi:hypothetical protein